jgi:hypothetical protein
LNTPGLLPPWDFCICSCLHLGCSPPRSSHKSFCLFLPVTTQTLASHRCFPECPNWSHFLFGHNHIPQLYFLLQNLSESNLGHVCVRVGVEGCVHVFVCACVSLFIICLPYFTVRSRRAEHCWSYSVMFCQHLGQHQHKDGAPHGWTIGWLNE